jgi:hypothetical protein
MFVQEFETADYLPLHLCEDLENFTEDIFMFDIHCPKNLCFSLHQTNKSMECFLRFLQIGLTVNSETFQVHSNGMLKYKYKILEREMRCCW